MNVLDLILFHCRLQPEAPAICEPGVDLVTYGRLEQAINNTAGRAMSHGLAPGQVVAICVRQQVIHAVLVLGLTRLGVVTASIGTGRPPEGLRFDAIVSDGHYPHSQFRTIVVNPTWTTGDGQSANLAGGSRRGADLCRITFSSGSTGKPKGVALTHEMVLGRILRYSAVYGNKFSRSSRLFCDMPLETVLGYHTLIYTLARGGTYFMHGNSVESTLRAFDAYKVDTAVASPSGLADWVARFDQFRCQHAFDVIVSAGSLLSPSLSERIRNRMSPNLISNYGSTEAGAVAAAHARSLETIPGAVGYVAPGMSIEIVDEAERPLPARKEGVIRIRGDHLADGYIWDPETSAQFFRGGWFYPGDIGWLAPDGLLVISGRQKLVLNVGGSKINSEVVEESLSSFDGIVQCAVLTVVNQLGIDEVWAAIKVAHPIDENRLREHCERKIQKTFVPERFVPMEALPTNEAGKLDRPRLAEMLKSMR